MKTTDKWTFYIVLIIILLSPFMNASIPKQWTLVDCDSGINLYERWVDIGNGNRVKERKAEMTVSGNINEVLSVLRDPSKTKQWMNNVSNAYLIGKITEKSWLSYTYFTLPWPLANRDMVSFSKLTYSHEGSSACIEITSSENIIPIKPEARRLQNYKVTWELRVITGKKTFISFSAVTYTPAEYPRFIQDRVMKSTFMSNLSNLKNLLEK